MKESYPLVWPDWPRTPLEHREKRKGWKKTELQAIADLELELKRFKAFSPVLTRKDPHDPRGAIDPSVAVYFSRTRDEDFSWQAALEISNPAPTREEVDSAFRKLSSKHHPDAIEHGSGGNVEIFHALSAHKKNAIAYVDRMSGRTHDLVVACDRYTDVRWNIFAVSNTVYSLRQMERDGASSLLERAFKGFAALPERAVTHVAAAS